MTGRQIIDAIQKYHLEDFDINYINDNDLGSKMSIEFDNGDVEHPYIHKYKVLEIDDKGNSKCFDKEFNTRKS